MLTILIKNGLVYDGSGDPPVKKDVLIKGERIARLGNFSKNHAEKIIDAAGAVVVPGFIDIGSSIDHYLGVFNDGWEESFLKEGVTTVIGGNCGSSLAPLLDYSLVSVRKWADISKLNVGWSRISEFLKLLEKRGLNMNFGTLVGHSTIRRSLLGEKFRDLTDKEIGTLKVFLKQAFKEGAFGFSTGLEYNHSRLASYSEIFELVKLTAKEGRIYATHLRDLKENLSAAVEETLEIAKSTHASIEISHLQPLNDFQGEYKKVQEMIESQTADTHVNFDCYPSPFIAVPIYQFLPNWAKKDNLEIMAEYLEAPHLEKKILEHLRTVKSDRITIGNMPPNLKFLIGKSLKEYAVSTHLPIYRALFKLMRLSHLRAVLLNKECHEHLIKDFLLSSYSLVASGETNLPSVEILSKHDFKMFTSFLKIALENNVPIEKAIAKLTAMPATKYKIKKRGLISENYFADVVVLRNNTPSNVFVNGKQVLEEGKFRKEKSGLALKYAQ